jgi:hypothetical protein
MEIIGAFIRRRIDVTLEGETIVVNPDGGLIEAGEEKFAVFEEWLMSL